MLAWQTIKKHAAPYYDNYIDALKNPGRIQEQFLKTILKNNQNSEFGQQYRFSTINSIKGFQKRLPIQSYSDLQPFIERMAGGDNDVLCSEPVLLFEQTSGTYSSTKLIPYTQSALDAFRAALFPWLFDLCEHYPGIMQGSAYWSISPVTRSRQATKAGIPIGIENDAGYFGETVAEPIQQTLAAPASLAQIESIEEWRYATLCYLVGAADLSLISIWSPTFLLQLLEALPQYRERLIDDLATGSISVNPDRQRAQVLADAVAGTTIDTAQLWPKLTLISCWASASSAVYAAQLQTLFPHVSLQAKGLLATEGTITVPMAAAKQPVLTLCSGFYEFLSDDGEIYLADELTTDEVYSVVLTNFSGLYRYHIGDQVKVVDWLYASPCLEFVGRSGGTDLCGEKLTEAFVLPHLKRIPGFTLLAPRTSPKPHYCLYLDAAKIATKALPNLTEELETALQQNPQYAYARRLQQLGPIQLIRTIEPLQSYQSRFLEQATPLGAIKSPGLSQYTDWHRYFELIED